MSDNVLIFIPTDPYYVPAPSAQQEARDLLSSFAPDADEVMAQTTDEVELVFTGTNLERIRCPVCGTLLDWEWWVDALDASYTATRFTNLLATLPCCGTARSLNDLRYEWPTGFTRFRLAARNPNKRSGDAVLPALERLLLCQASSDARNVGATLAVALTVSHNFDRHGSEEKSRESRAAR